MSNRPPFWSPGAPDSGPGKASNKSAFSDVFCSETRVGPAGRLGAFMRSAQQAAWPWGSWEGQARHSSGPVASCSRIQSNYMALQRINQELEDKLYRMVRAAPRCPTARPGTLTPLPQLWTRGGTPGLAVVSLPSLRLSHRPYFLTPGTGPVPPFLH